MEPYARIDLRRDEPEDVTYLPLMDCESKLLPIHFLKQSEVCSYFTEILYALRKVYSTQILSNIVTCEV